MAILTYENDGLTVSSGAQELHSVAISNVTTVTGYYLCRYISGNPLERLGIRVITNGVNATMGAKNKITSTVEMAYGTTLSTSTVTAGTYTINSNYIWHKVVYDFINDRITVYYSGTGTNYNGLSKLSDAINASYSVLRFDSTQDYLDAYTLADNLTSLGYYMQDVSASNVQAIHFVVETSVAAGGSLSLPSNIHSYKFDYYLGAQGAGNIILSDITIATNATHESNHGDSLAYYVDSNIPIFLGEFRYHKMLNIDTLQYVFETAGVKMMRQIVELSPVIKDIAARHFVTTNTTSVLWDKDETFSDYSSRIMVATHANEKRSSFHPMTERITDVPGTTVGSGLPGAKTPTDETGDIQYLYFYDPRDGTQSINDNRALNARSIENNEFGDIGFGYEMAFILPVDDVANISKVNVEITLSHRRQSRYGSNGPYIKVYDNPSSYYRTFYTITGSDMGGNSQITGVDDNFGEDETPAYTVNFSITLNPSNYFTTSAPGQIFRYIIIIPNESITGSHTLHVWYSKVEVEFSAAQTRTIGQYKPTTPSGTTDIPFTTDSVLTVLPSHDYIAKHDTIQICYTVDDFLDLAFTGATMAIDHDITGGDSEAISTDYTKRTFYQLLQEVTDRFNAIWWVDVAQSKIMIRSIDNLITVPITLTFDDVFQNQFWFEYDTRNIKNNVRVVGRDISSDSDISGTISPALGEEQIIYPATQLIDKRSVDKMLASKKLLHTNPITNVNMSINPTKTGKDYSSLGVGKLVVCKFPDASDPYILDDTLLIIGIGGEKSIATAHKEVIYINMRKRFS